MAEADAQYNIGSLGAEAEKRKQRLLALKRKQHQGQTITDMLDETPINTEVTLLANDTKPIFRNYQPVAEELTESSIPQARPVQLEEKIVEHLQDTKDTTVIDQVDLSNLAPRKIDWDLKRQLAPKLKKLERRTEKAINQLIRQRLREDKDWSAIPGYQETR